MANPQKENGHLRIANDIWDQLSIQTLSGSEFQLVLIVIRKTWGWNKKEESISIDEFISLSKLPRTNITRSLQLLSSKNILQKTEGGGRNNPSKWSFNKDYEKWQTVPKMGQIKKTVPNKQSFIWDSLCPKMGQFMSKNGTVSDGKLFEIKENEPPKTTIKTTIKDNDASHHSVSDEAYDLFAKLFEEKNAIPYMSFKGDFVQLAALRKSFKIGGKETPPNWEIACRNYLDSPMGSYSIAEMIKGNRYAILIKSKLNQYGKPDNGPQKIHAKSVHEKNQETFMRLMEMEDATTR